jgi:hypothetical protein
MVQVAEKINGDKYFETEGVIFLCALSGLSFRRSICLGLCLSLQIKQPKLLQWIVYKLISAFIEHTVPV